MERDLAEKVEAIRQRAIVSEGRRMRGVYRRKYPYASGEEIEKKVYSYLYFKYGFKRNNGGEL